MSDVFTKAKRSEVMSGIRGRGNKETEVALARLLRRNKIIGWRRHQSVFGKPDFIFAKLKLAVFVDGCFWHGCPSHATWPKQNAEFWRAKIVANQERDRDTDARLRADGWGVVRVWAHETPREAASRVAKLVRARKANGDS